MGLHPYCRKWTPECSFLTCECLVDRQRAEAAGCIFLSTCRLRYGLEDSESCLIVADLERLERAPLDEMRCLKAQVYKSTKSTSCLQVLEAFRSFPKLLCRGIPAVCMRGSTGPLPHGAHHFEELVVLGRSLDSLPRRPVDQDASCLKRALGGLRESYVEHVTGLDANLCEDRAMLMYTSGTTGKPRFG